MTICVADTTREPEHSDAKSPERVSKSAEDWKHGLGCRQQTRTIRIQMGETLADISRLVEWLIGVLQICIHENRMYEA
jgi:hypothetical protein